MRLICNLLDGMVAVEHQKKSPAGDLFNDAPDRISDVFIIMGAAIGSFDFVIKGNPVVIHAGYLASIIAILTAYVRVLGGAAGTPHYFLGPMAKPHRMALLSIALVLEIPFYTGIIPVQISIIPSPLHLALWVIIFPGIVTIVRRLRRIYLDLQSQKKTSR